MKSWGFSIQEDYLYLDWNRACKLIKLPWSWIHINAAHAFLGVNGEWLKFCEADKADAMRWQLPYNYTLDNGNVQQVTASVTVEKRVWKMRILPFIRKQYTSIEVEFDQEVGDRAGSWKGGCIACNYKLQRNEDPVSCLYRMEQERRFP
jgi:hypothetical protein